MKKPTSNGVDLYQIGNDYPQAPISAYFVASSYHDGIYTELNKKNLFSGVSSIDGFDDSSSMFHRVISLLMLMTLYHPVLSLQYLVTNTLLTNTQLQTSLIDLLKNNQ